MESYKGIKLPVDDLDLFDELEKMVELMEGWVNSEDDRDDDYIDQFVSNVCLQGI